MKLAPAGLPLDGFDYRKGRSGDRPFTKTVPTTQAAGLKVISPKGPLKVSVMPS